MELAELSLYLAPIVLPQEADSLKWRSSADGVFTKSLMMYMREKVDVINLTLAKTIWKGNHHKMKFFLWEMVHESISTSENLKKK